MNNSKTNHTTCFIPTTAIRTVYQRTNSVCIHLYSTWLELQL